MNQKYNKDEVLKNIKKHEEALNIYFKYFI